MIYGKHILRLQKRLHAKFRRNVSFCSWKLFSGTGENKVIRLALGFDMFFKFMMLLLFRAKILYKPLDKLSHTPELYRFPKHAGQVHH